MTSRIKKVQVSNFRSIKGRVDLDFDAPVVLVHGQNGTGKTSLLCALELGLTGSIPSLERFDNSYMNHLKHRDEDEARVSVWAEGAGVEGEGSDMRVIDGKITGAPLLSEPYRHLYSERCFLPQATLGRLLEIYESQDARDSDSPLTLFVKDLLGLDLLDNLIDGLYHIGDVRRLRNSLPIYRSVENALGELDREIEKGQGGSRELNKQISDIRMSIAESIRSLDAKGDVDAVDLVAELKEKDEESELQRLSVLKRELLSVKEVWRGSSESLSQRQAAQVEKVHAAADARVREWDEAHGRSFYALLDKVRSELTGVEISTSAGPEVACDVALEAVKGELERCDAAIVADAEVRKRQTELMSALERANARVAVLNEQLGKESLASGSRAEALAGVLPYITDEVCPVCQRDFAEVAKSTLRSHVSAHISTLTELAGRLEALNKELSKASSVAGEIERERSALAGKELADERRKELKKRRATFQEILPALQASTGLAKSGQVLIKDLDSASRQLIEHRRHLQSQASARSSLDEFARELGVSLPTSAEPVPEFIEKCLDVIDKKRELLSSMQAKRRWTIESLRELAELKRETMAMARALEVQNKKRARLASAKDAADGRVWQARLLVSKTRKIRTDVVRRVFNESLNSIWRELFVRLAPDEPFIPAFRLPANEAGPVEAVLETHYRQGGHGGNPRSMLSAGNLNTAALTLFLSLHLATDGALPWLVIDDPVQSMDEVHIAQFAALLRTLSKQHGRQIIIAVHEKPLFDYLALELGPAFPDDRLITIELSRTADGKTNTVYEPVVWKPDSLFAA